MERHLHDDIIEFGKMIPPFFLKRFLTIPDVIIEFPFNANDTFDVSLFAAIANKYSLGNRSVFEICVSKCSPRIIHSVDSFIFIRGASQGNL
jgi:hypothetical protein